MIAIDQDKAGKQGHRAWKSGDQEIWVRELSGGDRAVAVFNRGAGNSDVKVKWGELEMKAPAKATNLWSHQEEKLQGSELTTSVASHGVVLLRVH